MSISVPTVGANAFSISPMLLAPAQRGEYALDVMRHILAGVALLKKPQRQVAVVLAELLGRPIGVRSTHTEGRGLIGQQPQGSVDESASKTRESRTTQGLWRHQEGMYGWRYSSAEPNRCVSTAPMRIFRRLVSPKDTIWRRCIALPSSTQVPSKIPADSHARWRRGHVGHDTSRPQSCFIPTTIHPGQSPWHCAEVLSPCPFRCAPRCRTHCTRYPIRPLGTPYGQGLVWDTTLSDNNRSENPGAAPPYSEGTRTATSSAYPAITAMAGRLHRVQRCKALCDSPYPRSGQPCRSHGSGTRIAPLDHGQAALIESCYIGGAHASICLASVLRVVCEASISSAEANKTPLTQRAHL